MQFAAAIGDPNWTPCEIIYNSILKKYYQLTELCEACKADGHIDFWYGSKTDSSWTDTTIPTDISATNAKCGTELGRRKTTILRDPPKDLPVVRMLAPYSGCSGHEVPGMC